MLKQPNMPKIFFSLIFNEEHRGSVRVNLTKFGKGEWGVLML